MHDIWYDTSCDTIHDVIYYIIRYMKLYHMIWYLYDVMWNDVRSIWYCMIRAWRELILYNPQQVFLQEQKLEKSVQVLMEYSRRKLKTAMKIRCRGAHHKKETTIFLHYTEFIRNFKQIDNFNYIWPFCLLQNCNCNKLTVLIAYVHSNCSKIMGNDSN